MSEGFDLGAYLKEAGVKIDTSAPKIESIPIDNLYPHPDNFYSLAGLDDIADSILNLGLQEPLLVVENGSNYTIISGHRRWNALRQLVKEGHEEFRDIPCIVDRDPRNTPDLIKLKLLHANSVTRKMSDVDLLEQDKQYRAVLLRLKDSGTEFKGRMRDHIAQLCNVSTGKIARLEAIDKNLIPELKEKWKSGEINTDKAYNIARGSEDAQRAELALMTQPPKPAAPVEKILRNDTEVYMAQERERIANLVIAAEWWLPNAFDRLSSECLYRNDVVEYVKKECFRHATGLSSDMQYSFGSPGGRVRFGNSEWSVLATITEFADALMIAAYRKAARRRAEKQNAHERTTPLSQKSQIFDSSPQGASQGRCAAELRWNTGFPDENGIYICLVHESGIGMTVYDLKFEGGGWRGLMMCDGDYVAGWMPMPKEEPECGN